jgi:hypothetical protein
MKRAITRVVLVFNIIVWVALSSVNYIGIMQQLKEYIMKVFVWSIFTIILYVVITYSVTLHLKRILLAYQYRDYNLKYLSNKAIKKQIFLLFVAIIYLYGLCYYSSNFIGLVPVFIFFSKELMSMGRFYVYVHGQLYMIEDLSKEYIVSDFDKELKKLVIAETTSGSHRALEAAYSMDTEEIQFLARFFYKEDENLEAEIEPMRNII